MTQSFTYDGDALLRVRRESVELTEAAELGAVGTGRLTIDDTSGALEILGQKDFTADQSDCSNTVLARGFIGDQDYRRNLERMGASREIEVTIDDLNAMLAFRIFEGTSAATGDRPAETVDERLAWFTGVAGTYLPGVFIGTRIGSSDHGMDATNYRDQHPNDVLAGIVLAANGWNHYVRDFGTGDGPELVCRDDNTSTDDTSTIFISNVNGEQDGETIFPPFQDFVLSKKPGRVASTVRFSYAAGVVSEERPATAAAFNGERDLTVTDSTIKTAAAAHLRAQDILWQHHTEEVTIEGTVLLPSDVVNLAAQGDRIGVRLQHLTPEGFYDAEDWVYCRILNKTLKPKLRAASLYEARFRLTPQEAGPPVAAIIQRASFRTGPGTGTLILPNPVTIGSKLVYAVSESRCSGYPHFPNISGSGFRMGPTIWTRFNGTQESAVDNAFGTQDAGAAMFWKVAETTERKISTFAYSNVTVWELSSNSDPASASIQYTDVGTGSTDYSTPSLGTVAVGELAFAVFSLGGNWSWDYANSYAWQTPNPNAAHAAALRVRHSKWAYDHWSLQAYLPAPPWGITMDVEGAGASVQPLVQPGESGHHYGAIAVKIPPV